MSQNTSLQATLAPVDALNAVLSAGANFALAAERLNAAGYNVPTSSPDTYLATIIASDPSFYGTVQQQIRTHVMLNVLKLFSKVQVALEGAITKLDPYETMKAWNQIAAQLTTLSTPPQQPSNINNFNSMEFFLGQMPPNVREAFLTLVEGDIPQDGATQPQTIEHVYDDDGQDSDIGSLFPYLGRDGGDD